MQMAGGEREKRRLIYKSKEQKRSSATDWTREGGSGIREVQSFRVFSAVCVVLLPPVSILSS